MALRTTWRSEVWGGLLTIALPLRAAAAPVYDDDVAITYLVVFLFALAAFLIPAIVAFARAHPNRWAILVINMVFGATGLGWLGSLVWACGAIHRSRDGSYGVGTGLNMLVNNGPPPGGSLPARVPIDEIVRLKSLLDRGAIDRREYDNLKRRLLSEK